MEIILNRCSMKQVKIGLGNKKVLVCIDGTPSITIEKRFDIARDIGKMCTGRQHMQTRIKKIILVEFKENICI